MSYYRTQIIRLHWSKQTGGRILINHNPGVHSQEPASSLRQTTRRGLKGTVSRAWELGPRGCAKVVGRLCRVRRLNRRNRNFDQRHGVDTWQTMPVADLATPSSSKRLAEAYVPMPETTFHYILQQLDCRHSEYTFLDIGAGKGKVMLMAAEYPFKKIIGVEFASNLYRVARDNIERLKSRVGQASEFELRLEDAQTLKMPEGNCFVFLYAPFFGAVLERVLDNIRASCVEDPRDIILCFIDDDVPGALLERVAQTLHKWNLLVPRELGALPIEPGRQRPMVGTFWGPPAGKNPILPDARLSCDTSAHG